MRQATPSESMICLSLFLLGMQSSYISLWSVFPDSLEAASSVTNIESVQKNRKMAHDQKHDDIAISTLQVQVDDVKNVMTQNIEKVLKREEKLSELADRSEDLETVAHGFQKTTTKISRKMWWKNTKMVIIIVVILLIILVFIVLLATGVIPT
ncbi:vesicle-associated membrane protein 8-like [Sceloporus undulatus]|uniref:vesicle-associated membrane protein 8-like n=1 Tax=Sceloporus undulatus TaxID=8520 RepID=UPI001C4DAFF3|nr:vesicle-associated membrane protein 8-like [Sceloporus undulatus]